MGEIKYEEPSCFGTFEFDENSTICLKCRWSEQCMNECEMTKKRLVEKEEKNK
jgi:hypothetical protein